MGTTASKADWRGELAIADMRPPRLYSDPGQLVEQGRVAPQAHALRRAFEEFRLDAILCLDDAPAVYFREVNRIDPGEVNELHRRFWSQGLSPILVLIDQTEVHIYSGLARPQQTDGTFFDVGLDSPLVARLNRVAQAAELRQLVLSVESGEFFRRHARSFDRSQRVDRELLRNLKAARDEMKRVSGPGLDAIILDAVLCRIIFACYLFDRGVIDRNYLSQTCGIAKAADLRAIVSLSQREARNALCRLFDQLGRDFNGDLFQGIADDREALNEKNLIILRRLLHGADVRTGQGTFWPYDFSVIPIETISGIYEYFLKAADPQAKKRVGAFYTPRFLCEVLLDMALEGRGSLLGKRFLDPACGSGIFLVGLFNRLAEEWRRENPAARYDGRANGLMSILTNNLFGADSDLTACRITAFSLYLAFLDQMSPPEIGKLQSKGKVLPRLVFNKHEDGRSIFHGDFFDPDESIPRDFDFVVGNPPWASETNKCAPLVRWCAKEELPLPDGQKAIAFAWKAPRHLRAGGTACLILPHGVLFNHGPVSIRFQQAWFTEHATEVVLNLADFQRFLFEDAENPALVIRYRRPRRSPRQDPILYLTPKMDWNIAHAELLTIYAEDRKWIQPRDLFENLSKGEPPIIWKERYWGTPRDSKLLDRLRELPELGQVVGHGAVRWQIGQGFQLPGPSDGPDDRKPITLPTRNIIEARNPHFALFLLESDCGRLPSVTMELRSRSNTNVEVFRGPHVLMTDGFKVAFAEFDTNFRQAIRAIKGPPADAELLIFLSAYLNSPLARYYLFHTSANIAIERAKVEADDVLRLPFPLPANATGGALARELIGRANTIYRQLLHQATRPLADRRQLISAAMQDLTKIVYEYFDIDDNERVLIEDTDRIFSHSTRRKRVSESIPTLRPSNLEDRASYGTTVCAVLNDLARGGPYEVQFSCSAYEVGGVAVAVFTKTRRGFAPAPTGRPDEELPSALKRVQQTFRRDLGTVELLRGVKIFDEDRLYILKPLSQRFWTRTAALNDADEIAAAILSAGRKA